MSNGLNERTLKPIGLNGLKIITPDMIAYVQNVCDILYGNKLDFEIEDARVESVREAAGMLKEAAIDLHNYSIMQQGQLTEAEYERVRNNINDLLNAAGRIDERTDVFEPDD
jgi:hypothetical protein